MAGAQALMNAAQMAHWAAEIERHAEELAATAHALILQTRAIQEQVAKQDERLVPRYPEGTE